jgi:hypothetical protein
MSSHLYTGADAGIDAASPAVRADDGLGDHGFDERHE